MKEDRHVTMLIFFLSNQQVSKSSIDLCDDNNKIQQRNQWHD